MDEKETLPEATVECPYCAEKINPKAKKCRHCGEIIDVTMRELEMLKNQKQQVFMNAGGASSSSSASAAANGGQAKRGFPHGWHLFFTIITGGLWFIPWMILYLLRNREVYL